MAQALQLYYPKGSSLMNYNFILTVVLFVSFFNLNSSQWLYLKSEAFKTRYVLAANYLKNCSEVIEIGGYKTPISDFLDDRKITVIDPYTNPRNDQMVNHYLGTLDSWAKETNKYRPLGNYGVLILGFHLEEMSYFAWNYLYELISSSEITIIEFPIDWQPSKDQFSSVLANTNKKIQMRIILDLAGNDFGDSTNSWPPRTMRCLYFLK